MGVFAVELQEKEMASSQSSSTKTERKIIEKNRRNQMKTLYSNLNSVLPIQTSEETLSLPDQVDAAINYIKSLQTKLEQSKEKKESLMGRKRLLTTCSNNESMGSLKLPQIEIRETGSALEITLISGLDNQFMLSEIIHMIQEDGSSIVNASFSTVGDSIFHVIHAELAQSEMGFGATMIAERLNKFVHGSPSEVKSQPELWDFEIFPQTWEF